MAEALKYACNAFHATKVSFTNELARLFRLLGVDAREVMSLFCEDQVLNISPAYLRPGFAFGGSCLPKDLRSLLHLARLNGVDMPLLAGTLATNELVDQRGGGPGGGRHGQTSVALLGLSFKMDTDDLRESPNVELAERLIGKGFERPDLRPGGQPGPAGRGQPPHGRVQAAAPGPAARPRAGRRAARQRPGHGVVQRRRPCWPRCWPPRRRQLIDLSGRLGPAVEALPGYQGIGW